ncbi:MAG TPA: efflux RND transporter periplasmic adaptor subunit [Polyangia bacterium]|jgi:cobalt-zinc-cadmium efflux system membrane fusion protein|nr:efflux RND transporter periplasmic adaptor subunit [Polyangia bacterium]
MNLDGKGAGDSKNTAPPAQAKAAPTLNHDDARNDERKDDMKPASKETALETPGKRNTVAMVAVAALALGVGVIIARASAPRAAMPPPSAPVAAKTETPSPQDSTVSLRAGAADHNTIEVATASRAVLAADVQLLGNVSYSADHLAIVGPLVAGRVTRLTAGIGSRVERGQVIAEIESAEVGEARAALISATARLQAADANLRRERELAEKKISSAREREMAEAQWAIERAGVRGAEQRLRAIGLSNTDLKGVDQRDDGGRVPIRAPLSGTIIERLVTLGQAVERATDAFKIADLSKVWVLLDLYEKDLAKVRVGQAARIRTDSLPGEVFTGHVAYVVPVIDEATRTAKVRVEIDNAQRKLNIGQLVTAKLLGTSTAASDPVLTVPRTALQRVEGKTMVFVKTPRGFERRAVELGISGGDLVEIRAGLKEGEPVATSGAFLLKSELLR